MANTMPVPTQPSARCAGDTSVDHVAASAAANHTHHAEECIHDTTVSKLGGNQSGTVALWLVDPPTFGKYVELRYTAVGVQLLQK